MARQYRGVLSYRQDGAIIGREAFNVTVHADGGRTQRTICEMDNHNLTRDVTYTVNDRLEAVDAFVRVISENQFIGSGWFRFTDDMAEGEAITAAEGRVSQRIPTPGRVKLFGSHPVSVDVWKCAHVKPERPGALQVLGNCFSSSLVMRGAGGPMLIAKTYDITYVGPARVSVGAGTFDCLNFQWNTNTGRTLDMYTAPGDWLPYRVNVPEHRREFELVEFEEVKPAAELMR